MVFGVCVGVGRKLALRSLIWIGVALASSACEKTLTAPDPSTAYIVGLITAVQSTPASPRILVEADSAVDDPRDPRGNKIWLSIASGTRIVRAREDGTVVKAAVSDLRVGVVVAGWTEGVINLSYPAVAAAAEIVILEGPVPSGAFWMQSASWRILTWSQFLAPENTASNTLFHAAAARARGLAAADGSMQVGR